MRRDAFIVRWAVFLALLIVLLVVAMRLAERFDVRVDLTEGGLYTISPQSERILADLRDKVTIRYYVSSRMPTGFESLRRDTVDFLEEYARAADDMVEVKVVDPNRLIEEHVAAKKKAKTAEEAKKEETGAADGGEPEEPDDPFIAVGEREELEWAEEKKRELAQQGIPELRGRSVHQDSFEITNFYSSIEIRYLDRPAEVITVHQTMDGFEYELTSRIVRMTVEEKPKVAFFLGKADDRIEVPPDPRLPFQQPPRSMHPYEPFLRQLLAPQFDVVEVELTALSPIPEDAQLLIVAEPHLLAERQVYEIDRSIARGRPALVLVSNTTGDLEDPGQGLLPLAPDTIEKVFTKWGLSLGGDLISSESRANVQIFEEGPFGLRVPRPVPFALAPLVQGRGLRQESPLTRALDGLVFPFASELRPDEATLASNGLTFTPLATTEKSWLTPWQPNLIDTMFKPPGKDPAGEYIVAALIEGTFPTAFEPGTPLPAWPDAPEDNPPENGDGAEPAPPAEEVAPELDGAPGQVIVIGSADFAKVIPLQMYGQFGNISFLLSAVETMSLGQDLVKIRAKTQVARPLRDTTGGERNLARYGNLVGVPLLILLLALGRHFARRGRARAYEARFAGKEG